MVKILASGEIVEADDARNQNRQNEARQRQTQGVQGVRHTDDAQQEAAEGPSMFSTLNQRLLDMGIPRWNLGSTVVEPIVSVGLLLVLVLMGPAGLIFAGLLFLVSMFSQGHSMQSLWQSISGAGGRGARQASRDREATQASTERMGGENPGGTRQEHGMASREGRETLTRPGGSAEKFSGTGFRLGGR